MALSVLPCPLQAQAQAQAQRRMSHGPVAALSLPRCVTLYPFPNLSDSPSHPAGAGVQYLVHKTYHLRFISVLRAYYVPDPLQGNDTA